MIILKILIKKLVSLKTPIIKILPNVILTSDNIIMLVLFKIKIKTILELV